MIVRELAKDDTGGPVMPDEPDRYKTNDLHTYDQARRKKPTLVPYIAFQFDAAEFDKYKRFTVGNREESRDLTVNSFVRRSRRADGRSVYYNGPLEEETFYTVFLRAYVNKVKNELPPPPPPYFTHPARLETLNRLLRLACVASRGLSIHQ